MIKKSHFFLEAIKGIKARPWLCALVILCDIFFLIVLSFSLISFSQSALPSLESSLSYLSSEKWMYEDPTKENLPTLGIDSADADYVKSEIDTALSALYRALFMSMAAYVLLRCIAWGIAHRIMGGQFFKNALISLAIHLFFSFLILLCLLWLSASATAYYFETGHGPSLFALPLFCLFLVLFIISASSALSFTQWNKNALFASLKKLHLSFAIHSLALACILAFFSIPSFFLEVYGLWTFFALPFAFFVLLIGRLALIALFKNS